MSWLYDHVRGILAAAALLGLVAGGASWVAHAEEEHADAKDVGRLTKQNAEIIKSVKGWIDKEEAVREERQKIKKCLDSGRKIEQCVR